MNVGLFPIAAPIFGAPRSVQFRKRFLKQARGMVSQRDCRNQEIARLQLELANASQRLDELEKRSRLREKAGLDLIGGSAAPATETPELRFAAYVAFGMTKLQAG